MTDVPPKAPVEPARRRTIFRISPVWLVPIGALLVSLFIVWETYSARGPLITIAFENASGVRANETELRYRDVTVGLVEAVTFSDNLDEVLVSVRLDQAVAPYVDDDAQFWVIRPQVTAQGVSGIDTVLSGVYIAGSWNDSIGAERTRFDGLPSAPLARSDQPGLSIRLRSSDAVGLGEGTPILNRGVTVGSIANLRLADDGVSVLADGFIRAPYDQLVTSATRFWDTSGFSFTFGAQGAALNFSSLASLVTGGVAFDTTVSTGDAVESGALFTLFADEETARGSVFSDLTTGDPLNLAVVFDDRVSGLAPGAKVVFQGIEVGEVEGLTGIVDAERYGDARVRLLTTIVVQPARMGLVEDAAPDAALAFIDELVRNGMRAQLQNAGLLGGLQIALDTPPGPPGEVQTLDRTAEPYPVIPSIPAELSDFSDTAEGVFQRINMLPIEEVLGAAIAVMDSVDRLLNSDGVQQAPGEAVTLLGEVRGLVASPAVQGIPGDVAGVLGDLRVAVNDFDALLQDVRDAGAITAVSDAAVAAGEAADAVTASVETLPELLATVDAAVQSLDALIQTANALPLDALTLEAVGVLEDAQALLSDPAVAGLAAQLSATVAEAQALLADLRGSGIIEGAQRIVAQAELAIGEVQAALAPVLAAAERAAGDVGTAVAGLPQVIANINGLTAQIDTLLTQVNALPLAEVGARTAAILGSAEAILSAPAAQQLPADLSLALAEAQGLIAEIRAADIVATASDTLGRTAAAVDQVAAALAPVLDEAQRAAAAIASASDAVPGLVEQAEAIAGDLQALVAEARGLPLDQLVARATALLDSAQALVGSDETARVPATLAAALNEVQRILAAVREGGLIENANTTLTATQQAAAAFAAATTQLPGLVTRLNAVLAETESVLGGYDADGPLGSAARSALGDIRDAARSVNSLARSIERNPNSLLLGR